MSTFGDDKILIVQCSEQPLSANGEERSAELLDVKQWAKERGYCLVDGEQAKEYEAAMKLLLGEGFFDIGLSKRVGHVLRELKEKTSQPVEEATARTRDHAREEQVGRGAVGQVGQSGESIERRS